MEELFFHTPLTPPRHHDPTIAEHKHDAALLCHQYGSTSFLPLQWATPVKIHVRSARVATDVDETVRPIEIAAVSLKSSRAHQEDAFHWEHIVIPSLYAADAMRPIPYCGVFDGHGGDYVSRFLAEHLHEFIVHSPSLRTLGLPSAMVEALRHLDASLYCHMMERNIDRHCGSTAVAACLLGRELHIANLGDSRAVLSSNHGRRVSQLTRDHLSTNPLEKSRVLAAGGTIDHDRLGGDLAVTRAIGDFQYKNVCLSQVGFTQSSDHGLLSGVLPLSNIAELSSYVVTDADDFLLIASDGLWDVISPSDACRFVFDRCGNSPPLPNAPNGKESENGQCTPRKSPFQSALEQLVEHAVSTLRTSDNVTVAGFRF